jgi:hypothetical protein
MNIEKITPILPIILFILTSASIVFYVYTAAPPALISAVATLPAFLVSVRLHRLYESSLTPAQKIQKMMTPYKDLIVETTTKPTQTPITIEIKTLDDLAKISDIIAQPILHISDEGNDKFFIIENEVQFKYQANGLQKPEPHTNDHKE